VFVWFVVPGLETTKRTQVSLPGSEQEGSRVFLPSCLRRGGRVFEAGVVPTLADPRLLLDPDMVS
jgi:hypothetical protein